MCLLALIIVLIVHILQCVGVYVLTQILIGLLTLHSRTACCQCMLRACIKYENLGG